MNYIESRMTEVVGHKVTSVRITEYEMSMIFTDGYQSFEVVGDCCSRSYFYDFIGVHKLVSNGPIISVRAIDAYDVVTKHPDDERTLAYGFEFVTEHPVWGEQTSVVSFRNDSNGYYGGWMCTTDTDGPIDGPDHYNDILEVSS